MNAEERRQRAIQLFGEGAINLSSKTYEGRVTEGNKRTERKSECLSSIQKKYKNMSKRIDRS